VTGDGPGEHSKHENDDRRQCRTVGFVHVRAWRVCWAL